MLEEKGLVLPMCVAIGDLPDGGVASHHLATINVNITPAEGAGSEDGAG